MHLARVIGSVVSTRKEERLAGTKLLLLQPLSASGAAKNDLPLIAVDTVGAGVEEAVIYVTGSAARRALGGDSIPADAAIVGIVDHWDANGKRHQGV